MLAQLTELAINVGIAGDDDVQDALRNYVKAIPARPDTEKAAMMLLSAGERMAGECDTGSEAFKKWETTVKDAERLLGIVPLTVAK